MLPSQPRARISSCSAAALVQPSFHRWLRQGLNGSRTDGRLVDLTSSSSMLVDAGRLGELQDGVAGQSQAAGDLADRAALGAQRLDRRVAFPVPGDQAALVAVLVAEPVRLGRRASGPGRDRRRLRVLRAG